MKNINKIICLLFVLSIFFINNDVYALDYSVKQLIPVGEDVNVITDTFIYSGVKFVPDEKNKPNGTLKFVSITNNTSSRKTPSFNILLFDGSQKNIGYITYCAEKDHGSDNTMVFVPGKGSVPFEIKVSPRYFGANDKEYDGIVHEPGEILYYSFFSDNSYCQIGGYTKYIGLTLEEIVGGEVNFDNDNIDKKLRLNELILYLPYFLIGLVALIGYGLLLNSLYKRMHARTSILSYLPMTNLYIAVKLAFGKGMAWIFYFLCVGSFIVAFVSSNLSLSYIGCIFVGIATLVDIVKLITGKHDMFIIGKKSFDEDSLESTFSSNSGARFIEDGEEEKEKPVTADDILNSIDNAKNSVNNSIENESLEESTQDTQDMVDISYDSDMPISESSFVPLSNVNESFTTVNNMGEFNNNGFINNTLTPVSNIGSSTELNDDDMLEDNSINSNTSTNTSATQVPRLGEDNVDGDGESELSNFFR